ncbi:MAG: Yip1 family protein [Burkholderiaceae bacterium]
MIRNEDGRRLVARVWQILLSPGQAWPEIEREPATIGGIYREYLVWLALVPAVAGFIGASLIGYQSLGFGGRLGVGAGLVQLVVGFVLSLVGVYLVSMVVDWLAPKFGGTSNRLAAFKLVAYGSTAALVGGIFAIVPLLGLLGLLAAIYSIYLVYLGLPVLMKNPPARTLLYTITIVVCAIVVNLLIAAIAGWFLPGPARPAPTEIGVDARQDDAALTAAKVEELSRRIEEMSRRLEAGAGAGDAQDLARAGREAVGEMARGTGGRTPLEAARLKSVLPETVGGMERGGYEAESRSMMGLNMSTAKASYEDATRSLRLEIIDTGSAAGLLSGVVGWANLLVDRETDTITEKTWRSGDRVISVRADKDGSRAEYKLLLPNGIAIEARGRHMSLEEVTAVVAGLDLRELEAAE